MIPTPQELIKEAINSGPHGKGRQAKPNTPERREERLSRKAYVLTDMLTRKDSRFRDRSREQGRNALTDGAASKDDIKKRLGKAVTDIEAGLKRRGRRNAALAGAGAGLAIGGAGLYMLHKQKKQNEAALQAQRQAAQQQGQGEGQSKEANIGKRRLLPDPRLTGPGKAGSALRADQVLRAAPMMAEAKPARMEHPRLAKGLRLAQARKLRGK